MTKIQTLLFSYQDAAYKEFSCKLSPTISPDRVIGVRVPKIREIAKSISLEDALAFFQELPHQYNEENLLHGFLIQNLKDYDLAIKCLDEFLPFVDNWAVSDTMAPKIFKKHTKELEKEISRWIRTPKYPYMVRFGIDMYMTFYLDEHFSKKHLEIVSSIKSDEYYVNMMIAWYFATALAKQYEDTVKILECKCLTKWVHNKTIQKANESYRISNEHKEYLKSLRY